MGKIETSDLMTVAKLAGIRAIYGAKSATEQGVYSQIRQLDGGLKTSKDVGFEVVRVGSAVMVRVIDKELSAFSKKLEGFVSENKK